MSEIFDMTAFKAKLEAMGCLRDLEGTTFSDGTHQPPSRFRKLHGLEVSQGKMVIEQGMGYKVLSLPADALSTRSILRIARKLMNMPFGQFTSDEVKAKLLVRHKVNGSYVWGPHPTDETKNVVATSASISVVQQWLLESIVAQTKVTIFWCSPKSGVTMIWLYDVNGVPRKWGDIAPFTIEKVTAKLAKRLSFLVWECVLHTHQPDRTIQGIEVNAIKNEHGDIVKLVAKNEVNVDPNALQLIWWEEGDDPFNKVGDGWGIMARRLYRLMVDAMRDPLNAADPDIIPEMEDARIHNFRGAVPKGTLLDSEGNDVGTFLKGNVGITDGEAILVYQPNGKDWFNADLALSQNNIKKEVAIESGFFAILEHEADSWNREGKTNRHLMAAAYDSMLHNRIYHGLAMYFDRIMEKINKGMAPDWYAMTDEEKMEAQYSATTVNEYHRRGRLFQALAGDVTRSHDVLASIKQQTLDQNKPKRRDDIDQRDTRKYPIPGSEKYRSVKPLSFAYLAGWLNPNEVTLEDGEWLSTKYGFLTNGDTWCYEMKVLGGGDGDDHAMPIHGKATCDRSFKLTPKRDANHNVILDAHGEPTFNMIDVKAGDIVTVVWRTPIGVTSNDKEMAVEYFVLKPSNKEMLKGKKGSRQRSQLRKLMGRYDFNDMIYGMELDQLAPRVDEISFAGLPPAWQPSAFPAYASYDIVAAAAQLQGTIQVAGMVGMISNIDMFCFQHGIVTDWICHNEMKVDAFTQSILSPADIAVWNKWIEAQLAKIGASDITQLDKVALRTRFDKHFASEWIDRANDHLLFGITEERHIDSVKHFTQRINRIIRLQQEAMIDQLSDITIPAVDLNAQGQHKAYERYVSRRRDIANAADLSVAQLKWTHYNELGNRIHRAIEQKFNGEMTATTAYMEQILAWSYRTEYVKHCNNAHMDRWLMAGALLELTAKVLGGLLPEGEVLVQEDLVTIRCQGVHNHGCWIERKVHKSMADTFISAGSTCSWCK